MRPILSLTLLLAACSKSEQPPAKPTVAAGTFAGQGRDRLCLNDSGGQWHVGIVTYGQDNYNCTFKGTVVAAEHGFIAEAVSDPACRLVVTSDGENLRVGVPKPSACAYYCGPTASLADKSFKRDASATPAVDFAGDPLC